MHYKKLAGNKRSLGKSTTLWLGEDHLLAVESTGYSEQYTRYYLKDIQAIVSRRSISGKVWNVVFGSLTGICLVAGIGGYQKGLATVTVTAGIFAGSSLLLLLWNILRGPTCRCHVVTPVGIEELPPLDRVRSVKKALVRLYPLIDALQGEIKGEEITELARLAKEAPLTASPASRGAGFAARGTKNATSTYRGGLHLAAFLLLLADAGLSSLQMLHNSKALVSLTTFVSLAFLIVAIIALIKQKDHVVTPLARSMTWGAVVTTVTGSMVGYFFMIFLNFEKLKGINGRVVTQNDLLDFYAAVQPAQHPSFAYFITAYAIVAAGIAIIGLIGIDRGRGSATRRQP